MSTETEVTTTMVNSEVVSSSLETSDLFKSLNATTPGSIMRNDNPENDISQTGNNNIKSIDLYCGCYITDTVVTLSVLVPGSFIMGFGLAATVFVFVLIYIRKRSKKLVKSSENSTMP